MTLRQKTLLIIGITLISLAGILSATASTILLGGFIKIEQQDTHQNVQRARDALADDVAQLDVMNSDWAVWDDTYKFIQNPNPAYTKTNLNRETFARVGINLILYTHRSGRTVYAKRIDLETNQLSPVSPDSHKQLAAYKLLKPRPGQPSRTGIVLMPEGPMLVTARSILTSQGNGPVQGTLIMGRYLDVNKVNSLAGRTHLSLKMVPINQLHASSDFQAASLALKQSSTFIQPLNPQRVAGYTLIRDISRKPALVMRVDIPRAIYRQGKASIRYFIFSLLGVGLLFGVATLVLLEKFVLDRLSALSQAVSTIGKKGDLSVRIAVTAEDELSTLANEINGMLIALESVQKQQQESEGRLRHQTTVLAELSQRKLFKHQDLKAVLAEITQAASVTLEVERVSIWLFNSDRTKLICADLYQLSLDQHSQGVELATADYPVYLRALEAERTIATYTAQTDPRTAEFTANYFVPLGIASTLDAPIWLNGQIVGVIFHEHIDTARRWSLEEQNFVGSIADLVSLAMDAWERRRSEEALQKAHDELEARVQQRTTELASVNKALHHDATHDGLTGLPNRALFMNRLESAIEQAQRGSQSLFAVLFLDLDRFKVVNDSLGHMVGDQLLIAITRRLEARLRPGDTVARLGGDEFVILLEGIQDLGDATHIAERFQKDLALPFKLSGQEVFTTASVGIALGSRTYESPEDLMRDADTAMYKAKSLGKACYEIFNPDMHIHAVALLQLETDLRRAVDGLRPLLWTPLEDYNPDSVPAETSEFQIHYQPIVCLKTGKVTGFEALARWQHPERGFISPLEFIPVAEETGLIAPIGCWVLQEACRQTKTWQETYPETPAASLTVSVNLSARQFGQSDLIEQILQILNVTGLDARNLKLEITESAIMKNADLTAVMLSKLRAEGIHLHIDDFGTGYSSLSYLHRFPVDALKIDRSFISRLGIEGDRQGLKIVQTIVTLAKNLGMEVVAEGIETVDQLTQLQKLGCKYGQGFCFSQPLDSLAVEKLIDAHYRHPDQSSKGFKAKVHL